MFKLMDKKIFMILRSYLFADLDWIYEVWTLNPGLTNHDINWLIQSYDSGL